MNWDELDKTALELKRACGAQGDRTNKQLEALEKRLALAGVRTKAEVGLEETGLVSLMWSYPKLQISHGPPGSWGWRQAPLEWRMKALERADGLLKACVRAMRAKLDAIEKESPHD